MKNDRGCTYLITNGTHYKIDVTVDTLVKRVGELQTGSPTKISISAYCYNSSALAMKLELYQKFSHKRLEDGWFALDDDDVAIIHHHFENNYLDEYCTPLNEKRIEEINQEIEKKKQKDEKLKALRIRYAETSLAARNYNIEYNPNNDSKELIERLIEDVKDEDESWLQKHIKNNTNELERQEEKLKEREELAELEEQNREEQELKELAEREEQEREQERIAKEQELEELAELKELKEQEFKELKDIKELKEQELKKFKELKELKERKEREEQELKEFIELKERAEQERIAKEQEELKEREVYLAKERKKWAEEESEAYFAKERKKLEEQELKAKAKALVINRAKIFVFMGVVVIIGVAIL